MVLNISTDRDQTRGQYPPPPPRTARSGMDTVHRICDASVLGSRAVSDGGELGSMGTTKSGSEPGMIPPTSGHTLNVNDNVPMTEMRLAA